MKIEYISPKTSYEDALEMQESRVAKVIEGTEKETLFMVEHAPVYTCGTSADIEKDVLGTKQIPVVKTGRGGQITYHGPGQRVVYPILDLSKRNKDLRKYICNLQKWIIHTLKEFGIEAYSSDDVGVWVKTERGEEKIAAIGVRVRKWITFHGIALNVNPKLEDYKGIVPCGISEKGVTSMEALGVDVSMEEVDKKLIELFPLYFS